MSTTIELRFSDRPPTLLTGDIGDLVAVHTTTTIGGVVRRARLVPALPDGGDHDPRDALDALLDALRLLESVSAPPSTRDALAVDLLQALVLESISTPHSAGCSGNPVGRVADLVLESISTPHSARDARDAPEGATGTRAPTGGSGATTAGDADSPTEAQLEGAPWAREGVGS